MITLRLISLLGILTFLGLAWAMSTHRRNIPWRVVGWGMGLQLIIALLVFQTQLGQGLFEAANVAVTKLNEFANEGSNWCSDRWLSGRTWKTCSDRARECCL